MEDKTVLENRTLKQAENEKLLKHDSENTYAAVGLGVTVTMIG